MKISDYIKVDLFGQNNNDTSHLYTFPDKVTNQYAYSEKTQWVAPIMDPRGIYQSVCNTGASCYVLMRHKNGTYYSYIERNAEDSRGGLLMLTIFIARGHSGDGASILDTLKRLRNILIVNKEYYDSAVESCVENIVDRPNYKIFPERRDTQAISGNMSQASVAYRTYNNDTELVDLFSFTFQSEYEDYDKLIIVNSKNIKEGISIPRIVAPVVKHYNIRNAEDAIANCSFVTEDEPFTITYSKKDCCKQQIELTIKGNHVKYYSIIGNEVKLKSAAEAGVNFNKKFEFHTTTIGSYDKEIDIHDVNIIVNGHVISSDAQGRKYLDMKESEIEACPSVNIHATYPHHEEFKASYDISSLKNGQEIKIAFTPIRKTEVVKFRFDQITLNPIEIKCEETSSLYEQMYSGRFCGYRAFRHRDGILEVYIPNNHNPHLYDEIDGYRNRKKHLPKWAKILIITMSVLFLIAGSFLGGYVFGKYLENNHKEQTYFEPEPMQQQTPTIQIEDSTSQNEE